MIVTKKQKQKAFKIVYEELAKNPLFCGVYNAKYGSIKFMFGVSAVMESIANEISNEYLEHYSKSFMENVNYSQEKYTKERFKKCQEKKN